MKRMPRKRVAPRLAGPTPDQIRGYIQVMAEEHQQAWHAELMGAAPYWVYLMALHLRLVELDHMEEAAQEFL